MNDIPIKHYSPPTSTVITLYMPRLKLNRFRKLYKSLKTPWKPLNWLILGYLIGIEDRYITIVSKQTVDTAIEDYLDNLATRSYLYRGFNLILGDGNDFFYYSNQLGGRTKLDPGFYGLSNQLLDCDWPKVNEGREKFRANIESKDLDLTLFDLLSDEGDSRAFSNSFIASADYGTRSQTVITWRTDDKIKFVEKNFSKRGKPTSSNEFTFSVV